MNVEIVTEAAQFPEKEYINVIFVTVYDLSSLPSFHLHIFSSNLLQKYCIIWVFVLN